MSDYQPKHRNHRHEDSCGLACESAIEGAPNCETYGGRHRATRCGHIVGPIPKLDGEVLVCHLDATHTGEHESASGAWWIRDEDGLHDHYGRAS